jgi:uncharacterized protein (DUF2062 family)
MPRKLIKKYMPDEKKLKDNKYLGWLGSYIHDPNLWHLTRKSVSRAFLIGLFCAFIPIPLQMLLVAVLAIVIHSNLPISIGLVWLTNPITMPPIFYFTYLVGDFFIGKGEGVEFEMSMEWLSSSITLIWWPLLFGSILCGLVFGIAGYFLIQWFWAWHVNRSWKKRGQKNKPS